MFLFTTANFFLDFSSTDTSLPPNALLVKKILETSICVDWKGCVAWARNKFEKYFNHKARHLLENFPADSKTSSGELFWAFPKRLPAPISFDPKDDLHLTFVRDLSRAIAAQMEIKVSSNASPFSWQLLLAYPCHQVESDDLKPEALLRTISEVGLAQYTAKKKAIVTDESLTKDEASKKGDEEAGDAADLEPERFADICRKAHVKVRTFQPTAVVASW